MIIDGIEYCVALFIDKEISEIEEALYNPSEQTEMVYFPDFYGFNQFVRDNKDNPQYSSACLHYSLVEVIDGEPDDFSWLAKLSFKELSDAEIQNALEEFGTQQSRSAASVFPRGGSFHSAQREDQNSWPEIP